MVRNNNGTGLKSVLHLCSNVNTNDAMAVATAVGAAIDPFMGDVQYNSNDPSRNFVALDCALMTGTGDPLKRLTNFIFQKYGSGCINADYNSDIAELQKSNWNARYIGSRLWLWQTCTEFGYYQGLLELFNFQKPSMASTSPFARWFRVDMNCVEKPSKSTL